MKNLKKTILISLLFVSVVISGHEFWLAPSKFQLTKGDTLNLRLRVGENFNGENWTGDFKLVKSLSLYFKKNTINLNDSLNFKNTGDSLSYAFSDNGSAIIAFQSNNKYIELKPDKFLEYLREDGLENAIIYRATHHEKDSISKEFYQRCVKTLVQIGNEKDDTYKIKCNLPVEFIPLNHPYLIEKNSQIRFKLLFNNVPLPNYKVKIWHKYNQNSKHFDLKTNNYGEFSIPVSRIGNWMVSTVKMERIDASKQANWQSYWASFTWGY